MKTNEKLKEILMNILKQPVAEKTEPGISCFCIEEAKVIPGYDSELEKIANGLIDKAAKGDVKAIDKIREIVGDVEWPENIVC